MRFFSASRLTGGKDVPADAQQPEADIETGARDLDEKNGIDKNDIHENNEPDVGSASSSDDETPSANAPDGVRNVEAVTIVWTKKDLIIGYACIFLVFFVNSLQQQITNNLYAYVISSFSAHSLMPVATIVSGLLAGVLKLPTAQLMNIWGRPLGLVAVTGMMAIGLAVMAGCQNVETYVAGQCFYWVGFNGMSYVLDVFIADTSNLKNRALAFAFSTTPYIATTFAGPTIATRFYQESTWQWAFGCFAIIVPVVTSPILYIFYRNEIKAKKLGLIKKVDHGRTAWESAKYYFIEFDVIGIVLIVAGFVLFLLPFSIAGYQTDKWASASIIVMIVIGVVCLVAFGLYERFLAPKCFIPWNILTDRTVVSACVLSGVLFVSFYLWDGYYYSYLQVVHGVSMRNTGYIVNIYSIGSCFWSVVVAVAIRKTGRFKWLALYFGCPLMILGVGLMIHFRQPGQNIGYIIMCQIFIAFAGGTLVICEEMAAMACVTHAEVAQILALLGLSSSVGGAIGSSISGAIWTNTLPGALIAALPEGEKDLWSDIYASIVTQLSYPLGSPVRDAILEAYGIAQKRMTIAATSVLVLSFVCVFLWRDIRVSEIRNVKGRVL